MVETLRPNRIELLPSPWEATFVQLLESVHNDLLIASPFLGAMPLRAIATAMMARVPSSSTRIHLLTNLAAGNLLGGSLDVMALLNLARSIPTMTVTYLPSLHAKVYIADNEKAIITSANLTFGGLVRNHEYGVVLRDSVIVRQVRADLTKYATLGSHITLDGLQTVAQATQELKATRDKVDTSANAKLRAILNEQIERTRQELLEVRVRGKTRNGIYCDTILYLLDEHGPLTTQSLHPLVQQIHPDLCDDTVDRVIDGVHYGKKWKHYVRDAQQTLKGRGVIHFDGTRWFRTESRDILGSNDITR
jgi:hypothetical protein